MFREERSLIMLSGGFDPLHVGHLRMIQDAAQVYRVIIALNSDDWLMRKKGFMFMPWDERRELLLGIRGVYEVVAVDDKDDTVCEALERINPDYFGNGGDRTEKNTPEMDLCRKLGITMMWGLGGEKIRSSSALVKNAIKIIDAQNGQEMTTPHY